MAYYRPIPIIGHDRPDNALRLAGGSIWFSHVEVLDRSTSEIITATELPKEVADNLTGTRGQIAGLDLSLIHI